MRGEYRLFSWLLLIPVFILLSAEPAFSVPFVKNVMPGKVSQPHAKVEEDCLKCHALLGKTFLPDCVDCHKEVREDLDRKRGYHGKIDSGKCESCHPEHKGREFKLIDLDPAKFDHHQTEYLLVGKHQEVECGKCHKKPKYRETPRVCFSCHEKDDPHKKVLGKECADCHVPQGWKEIKFDHSKTDFPLTGKHAPVACGKCHTEKIQVKDTPKECVSCHRKDDPHKEFLGAKCGSCHTTQDWKTTTFDHGKTDYPLVGKHRETTCIKCHVSARLKETPHECFACHKKDDPHKGNLGTTCDKCHNPSSWKKEVRFDHAKTKFPLLGKHKPVACKECHKEEKYQGVPIQCVSCHKKDDPHKEILGSKCEDCHTEKDWKSFTFDHEKTKFSLKDKHRETACLKCHKTPKLTETPKACFGCHEKDDVHKGKLGEGCDKCHNAKSWKKAPLFDHQKVEFPLRGKHKPAACDKCHKTQIFKDLSTVCYDCHKKDDEHRGRFGKKCEKCHTEETWERKDFDHKKETGFALRGAHTKAKCLDCHRKALFSSKTPTLCGICHRPDDVHNGELGLKCDRCHNVEDFSAIQR